MVGQNLQKVDGKAIVSGKAIYTEDLIFHKNTLTLKILRSPYAFAKVKNIDIERAKKLDGVELILTYKDVPNIRYTEAGESFPEASPHDRLILDQIVRYIGDEVAIIAAIDKETAEKASKLIKVEYEVYEPLLDPSHSIDSKTIIHEEDNVFEPFPFGLETERNIVSKHEFSNGDIEKELLKSDLVIERQYITQQQQHSMMETHRAYAYIARNDTLTIISATQSAFHMRRQVAHSLNIPMSKIRLIKPRIGGGFGGKNIALLEPYVAIVTWLTKKPCKLIYTRKETFMATNTRHSMIINLKIGASKDGKLNAIKMNVLNNTGAYGGNGPATLMESGQNVLPLYNRANAIDFYGNAVYTNIVSAGPLRGYGATQGVFALESAINEIASLLNIDPVAFKLQNCALATDEGGILHAPLRTCKLTECIERGRELIGWDEKYQKKQISENKVRSVGVAIATHGSGIANVDSATVTVRLEEDGCYKILTGSSDIGTGSDTIITQIVAEELNEDASRISIYSGDTEACPYDTGAYASCTTFVTGNAALLATKKLKSLILNEASKILKVNEDDLYLENSKVYSKKDKSKIVELKQIGLNSVTNVGTYLTATESFIPKESPKPFMAGFVEIEVDTNTYKVKVIKYVAIIDSGNIINPKLAKVQAEGGLTQGIGLGLYEEVKYNNKGRMLTGSFLNYKIPTRKEIGEIIVEFVESYDERGPFGAKSLGEIVVHTPAPAIANAVYNALGVYIKELPITPEKIFNYMHNK